MARELGIEPGRLGIIFSIGVLGGVLGAMTCGPLADRVGPKRILALSTLWFGVFQLATSFASGFSSLLLLRAFAGFGLGAAAPCFLALAAAHTTSDRRSTVLSMLWACFPFGALVGGVVNGWIVQHLGWRVVFVTGGVLPIVLAFVLLAVVAEAPRTRTPSPSAGSGGSDWHAPTWWTDPYLRERLLLLWCILFGAFGALAGIVVWMPTILVKAGLSPSLGGLVLSWHAVGALISMASAGYLTKRFGARVLAGGPSSGPRRAWLFLACCLASPLRAPLQLPGHCCRPRRAAAGWAGRWASADWDRYCCHSSWGLAWNARPHRPSSPPSRSRRHCWRLRRSASRRLAVGHNQSP
jgi:MFS family permease